VLHPAIEAAISNPKLLQNKVWKATLKVWLAFCFSFARITFTQLWQKTKKSKKPFGSSSKKFS
jgi:hypothetical protein